MNLLEAARKKVAEERTAEAVKQKKSLEERNALQEKIVEIVESLGFTKIEAETEDTGRRDVRFLIGDNDHCNNWAIVGIFAPKNGIGFLPPFAIRHTDRDSWVTVSDIGQLKGIIEHAVLCMVRRKHA